MMRGITMGNIQGESVWPLSFEDAVEEADARNRRIFETAGYRQGIDFDPWTPEEILDEWEEWFGKGC